MQSAVAACAKASDTPPVADTFLICSHRDPSRSTGIAQHIADHETGMGNGGGSAGI
jgi:hypothetical protein